VLTLFIGHVGLGAQRWLGWGPFKFQPSELAKVATVVLLANFLSERRLDLTQLRSLVKPCVVAGVPFLLVLKQPDLGTSVTFITILFTMLYWAGLPLLYLFLLVSPIINVAASFYLPAWIVFAAVLSAVLYRSRLRLAPILLVVAVNLVVGIVTPQVWNHLQPYQRQRIATFLDPAADPGRGIRSSSRRSRSARGRPWERDSCTAARKRSRSFPSSTPTSSSRSWGRRPGSWAPGS
jgi:rod shape determining protein RodA